MMKMSKCPRCGQNNKCGLEAGKSICWCFHKKRLEREDDDICYCEKCYDQLTKTVNCLRD